MSSVLGAVVGLKSGFAVLCVLLSPSTVEVSSKEEASECCQVWSRRKRRQRHVAITGVVAASAPSVPLSKVSLSSIGIDWIRNPLQQAPPCKKEPT